MNKRLLSLVAIVALAAGGIWYFTQPQPAEPAKVAEAPKPVTPAAPKPAAPSAQVVAPKAPAAPTPTATPAPAAAKPAVPANDVATELNNTITDMAALLQAGDMATLMEKYMPPQQQAQMTPEMKAQMMQAMQSPQMQQQLQMMTQALQSLQGQTPEINAAGDEATYQMTPPPGMAPPGANVPATIPVTFVKIDGRWYMDSSVRASKP